MAKTRRVLIVSPHFPPTNAPDMQRARQCLPYLAEHGWEAEVLAVDPRDADVPADPLLSAGLPSSIPVHRVRAMPLGLGKMIGMRSLGPRSRFALGREGDRLLAAGRFDLVFFSTTQFIVLNLGARWKKRHGVPYVLDWQDPWWNDYYERPGAGPAPGGWKYRVAAWQARRHEGPCIREAAGIVSTSPLYLQQLGARYPWFGRLPAATIPFGVEPADFEVAASSPLPAAMDWQAGCKHVVYVGALTSGMEPALGALFSALSVWRGRKPQEVDLLRFHFIGTSYNPSTTATPRAVPLAAKFGLADIVDEQTSRIGHFAALRTLRESDAVMIIGSDDEGYSPSKLATLAMARRPILALLSARSPLAARLADAGIDAGLVEGDQELDQKLRNFISQSANPVRLPPRPETLTASARTADLCALFERSLA